MQCFILGTVAFEVIAILPIVQLALSPMPGWNLDTLRALIAGMLIALIPIIPAVLTYKKMVQPLSANVLPSKRWASTLEILGYFFGLIAGGYILWIANEKIRKAQDSNRTPD
jgi:membrane-associated protease RseP (regulator of RpoE activity)